MYYYATYLNLGCFFYGENSKKEVINIADNVVREAVVQIGFDIDVNGLDALDKEIKEIEDICNEAVGDIEKEFSDLELPTNEIEDFKSEINSIDKSSGVSGLGSELNDLKGGFADVGSTVKSLPITLKQLTVDKLSTGVDTLKSKFRDIGSTVKSLPSTIKQLTVDKVTGGVAKLNSGFTKIKNLKLSDVTSKLKSGLDKGISGAKKLVSGLKEVAVISLDKVAAGLKNVAKGLGGAVGGITKGLGVGIGVVSTAMAGLTVKALNLGGELEQNIGGSEAVFKNFASTMQETGKTAFSSMGLSQSDFLANANKMGALFQGAGFSIEKSADLSAKAMQRSADVASIMGIDVGDAMEAVAGAAKGNFTMMDNLGVAMNDTSIAAYAASKGIKKSSKQMTQQEKIGLAMEMFLDRTAYAAGNYAKENDTLAGSLTTAKAALSNFLSGSGDADALVSSFVNAANIIIDNVSEIVPRLSKGIVDGVNTLLPKIPGLLADVLPVLLTAATQIFQGLIETVQQNKQPLIALAVTIIGSLATFLLNAIPDIILVGVDLLIGLVQGLTEELPQIITVAMQSIGNFIDGIMSRLPMINQASLQLIQTLISGLIANLPMIIQTGIRLLSGLIQGNISMLPALIQMALQLITAVVQGLIDNLPMIINAAVQLVISLIQGIVTMLPLLIDTAIQLIIFIFQALIENLPMILQAAITIVVALASGLVKAIPQLIEAIPQLISAIIDTILHTDWLDVGWQIVKGIGKGLFDGVKSIFGKGENGEINIGAIDSLGSNIDSGATGVNTSMSNLNTSFDKGISGIDTSMTNLSTTVGDNAALINTSMSGLDSSLSFDNVSMNMDSLSSNINSGAIAVDTSMTNLNTSVSNNADLISSSMSGLDGSLSFDSTSGNIDSLGNSISNMSTTVQTDLNTLSNNFTKSMTTVDNNITKFVGAVETGFNSVKIKVTDAMKSIEKTVSGCNLYKSGVNIMDGLNKGLLSQKSTLLNTAKTIADSIKYTINDALDIHSPSREMMWTDEMISTGLIKGIQADLPQVDLAVNEMSDIVLGTSNGMLDTSYTPENSVTKSSNIREINNNNPVFNLTIQGANMSERELESKTKKWVKEGMREMWESLERRNPEVVEV